MWIFIAPFNDQTNPKPIIYTSARIQRQTNEEKWKLGTGVGGNRSPVAGTMFLYVRDQSDVFLGCPWTFLHSYLVAAWQSPHIDQSPSFFFFFFFNFLKSWISISLRL